MSLYLAPFETLSFISQKLKRSRNPEQIPFGGNLLYIKQHTDFKKLHKLKRLLGQNVKNRVT